MIRYRASRASGGSVDAVEALRETVGLIVFDMGNGLTHSVPRINGNAGYFASEAEAIAWLIGRAEIDVDRAQAGLADAEKSLARLRAKFNKGAMG